MGQDYSLTPPAFAPERQITSGAGGRILTNCNVWSPDSQWIVYDTRSDPLGAVFDGEIIEIVNVATGAIRRIYESKNGARCGVATFHPQENRVAFLLGPENPTPDWEYGPAHRQGVWVDLDYPGVAVALDARDLAAPLTPGALRGGSHVHVFRPDGNAVSFTYNDAPLSRFTEATADHDDDRRNIGVSVPLGPVTVPKTHPRNHDGAYFSVLVTRTTAFPRPGSDAILQALEEGWIGTNGYIRPDGTRQNAALAFQGQVIAANGNPLWEVFCVDLPDDLTAPPPDGKLEGTATRRPLPPQGTVQRRLTRTEDRKYPGISGPRHWLRSSPDGAAIAFLMRDDSGIVQLWTVSPNGGEPRQVTFDSRPVASAFTWSPDGKRIAYIADNSVFTVEFSTGRTERRTPRTPDAAAPLPLACVFSPDGTQIAFLRRPSGSSQICVVSILERLKCKSQRE